MKVEIESVLKHSTSCNFCNRGEMMKHRVGFQYPYEDVVVFIRDGGNGIKPAICESCLNELHAKSKALFNPSR